MKLQEGIYYTSRAAPGKSFCIVSLRAKDSGEVGVLGFLLYGIFKRLAKLKLGLIEDLELNIKHRKMGNLTVLLGYGPKLFDLPGSKKSRPFFLADNWNFKTPNPSGGGQIIDTANVCYSPSVTVNHLLLDHVILQLIADNEFYTKRAVLEVWKELRKQEKSLGHMLLNITGIYSGFQRDDQRSWLGFHDGVSNLTPREREHVILINSRSSYHQDRWTFNGTYLAFMRMSIDLNKWDNTPRDFQEIIIGRDKLTGCPLIRVDKNNKPVKDSRCPVPGTSEIIDRGNEHFRNHPPYTTNPNTMVLQMSHIGSTRPIDKIPIWDRKSLRIYRQGFDYLERTNDYPGFDVGLNFVSFQNTPERLHRALTYQHMISQRGTANKSIPKLEQFISVSAAGIFLVPPLGQYEPFPGAQIFFSSSDMKNISSQQ